MPRFEVYIPSTSASPHPVTLRVDAENWMAALKTGFQKLGEQGLPIHNALVDVQDDNSLHVTEASSGRVFRIRELTHEEAAQALPKARPLYTPAPVPTHMGRTQVGMPERLAPHPFARPLPHVPAGIQATAMPVSPRARNTPSAIIELEAPVQAVRGTIGRAKEVSNTTVNSPQVDALEEVFERVSEISRFTRPEDALYFLLDLALEKIPAEAGSALLADAGTGDVRFAATRGPKADALLKANLVVPAGEGIVGFCAAEGVSLALSDVQKDPRHYSVVAERVGYEVKSALCSPMMDAGRTFGCMQLLNRKGGSAFTEYETGMLAYIAHQAALFLKAH